MTGNSPVYVKQPPQSAGAAFFIIICQDYCTFGGIILILTLGLCYIFYFKVLAHEGLRGYRMARRMMGIAY